MTFGIMKRRLLINLTYRSEFRQILRNKKSNIIQLFSHNEDEKDDIKKTLSNNRVVKNTNYELNHV